jgi:glycosyltransferase involved in cell wall biosynthesis
MENTKPTVSMFIPSMHGGGAQRVVLNLANAFVQRGLPVNLLLAQARGPYLSDVASEVRIIDFDVKRSVFALPHLVRHMRRERPNFLLSALNYANLLAMWAAMIARTETKTILTVHSTLSRDTNTGLQGVKERALPVLMRWAYPRSNAVVVVSEGAAQDLKQQINLPDWQVKVINNPVVTPDMIRKAKEPPPAIIKNIEEPIILGAGRLNPHKDFETLVRAFRRVRQQCEAQLIIIGEGGEREALESLINKLGQSDSVQMPGFFGNPYPVMARSNVFVLSSSSEGFGNVLVEAMAMGVPVVSTDCPNGPAEILEGGKWGKLVPVGDARAMSKAICETLKNPPDPGGLLRRAGKFTSERIAEKYLDLISSLHTGS